jgi:G3E family GTPase
VALFERVVIETSGLADPAPILHALMSESNLVHRLSLAGVITTVDAVNGLDTITRQPESMKQVAMADHLVLTKTDLLDGVDGNADALVERLAAINPSATLLTISFGDVTVERLFDIRRDTALERADPRWLGRTERSRGMPGALEHPSHDAQISCFAIERERPIGAVTLTLLLEVLAEHCGRDLLRLKGIVNVAECPDRPAVLHGVQHVFHPPTWLEAWPSEDRRSRLVFIVRDIPRTWIESLLKALEAEVGEVTQSIKSVS